MNILAIFPLIHEMINPIIHVFFLQNCVNSVLDSDVVDSPVRRYVETKSEIWWSKSAFLT